MTGPKRALVMVAASLLLLAACRAAGTPVASPVPVVSVPPASPAGSETAAPTAPRPVAQPGTPYAATDLLAAMRDSRRPGGVPDELETEAIAGAIAERAWTWDGEPWESLSVGAACGPDACSLDLAGTPAGGAGTDLYSFAIDTASGAVELLSTDLHGYPADLEEELDAATRAVMDPDELDGLALVGARWLAPPDTGRYWLAYRSGGEEGSPGIDVLLDLTSGEVLEVADPG
ncbi:MAG TPA: hypothetical protein VF071_07280 [Candidatus Limnocylindria bacterium]